MDFLTIADLSKVFKRRIKRIEVPDSVKKLEQSDVSIILLHFDDSEEDGECSMHQLLLKYVDVADQKNRIKKTDEKWKISVRSFENENNFYSCCEIQQMKDFGVPVPLCYYKSMTREEEEEEEEEEERSGTADLVTSTLLLEYFSGEMYCQYQDLTFDQAKAALKTLARFHAFHWRSPGQEEKYLDTIKGLFPQGAWWRTYLRPSVKYHTIVESFESLCTNFPEEIGNRLGTEENIALMRKLQDHIKELDAKFKRKKNQTIIHGDCKTSNLFFFSLSSPKGSTQPGHLQEQCDFQWTGAASSGGGDVAYLLWSGLELPAIEREEELLDYYLDELNQALHEQGKESQKREDFRSDYELEVLDLFKTCLPQLLNGIDPDYCRRNFGLFGWLTHEYSPPIIKLFVEKVLDILKRISF